MNDTKNILFLSVKPKWANLIMSGKKTLELRKLAPLKGLGERCLIYSSSPTCKIIGHCKIEYSCWVESANPNPTVLSQACISAHDMQAYADGSAILHGLRVTAPRAFPCPIPLKALRDIWRLEPPQQWRYIDLAIFDELVQAGR